MKRRFLWLGVAAIAIGLAVLAYRGPGRAIVRGNIGDVAAAMLVYAMLGAVWRARIAVRAFATFAIATAIELGQALWTVTSTVATLSIVDTCDPWDIVAYTAGTGIAVGWDVLCARHARPLDRPRRL